MRWLPKSFVVHQWVLEANRLALAPISVSLDTMEMRSARPETVEAYTRMAKEANAQGVRLKVIWAFRSADLQRQQYKEAQRKYGKRKAMLWLAPPGYSEHQTGWALDIGDETNPQADDNPLFERTAAFRWLKQNARRFGFEMSFPPNNWQGVSYEPWHWRFVGTPEARDTFHPKRLAAFGIWGLSFLQALKVWIYP